MMKKITAFGLGLVVFFAGSYEVSAHSLESLENQLHDKEKYFQPLDKEAPDFTLQDADGRTIGSTDLLGKVVVLNFVYTNSPDRRRIIRIDDGPGRHDARQSR